MKCGLLKTGLFSLAAEGLHPHLTRAFTCIGVLGVATSDSTHCCRVLLVLLVLPPLPLLAVPFSSQGKSPAVP